MPITDNDMINEIGVYLDQAEGALAMREIAISDARSDLRSDLLNSYDARLDTLVQNAQRWAILKLYRKHCDRPKIRELEGSAEDCVKECYKHILDGVGRLLESSE